MGLYLKLMSPYALNILLFIKIKLSSNSDHISDFRGKGASKGEPASGDNGMMVRVVVSLQVRASLQ